MAVMAQALVVLLELVVLVLLLELEVLLLAMGYLMPELELVF